MIQMKLAFTGFEIRAQQYCIFRVNREELFCKTIKQNRYYAL